MAIKILDKSKLDAKTQRMLTREIAAMESLHHPHIIRLYEVIETLSRVHLVMEFAHGGELFQKITSDGKYAEEDARLVFAQVASALDHMVSTHFAVHANSSRFQCLNMNKEIMVCGVCGNLFSYSFSVLQGRRTILHACLPKDEAINVGVKVLAPSLVYRLGTT